MRDRVHHVAGEQQPDRHVSLAGTGSNERAIGADRYPVGVWRVGGAARRAVVQRARDRSRLRLVDHRQRVAVQPPAHPVALNPALGGQVGDHDPLAVQAAGQRLDPRAHGQGANRGVVQAGAAPHVDALGDTDPVDVRRSGWLALGQRRSLRAQVRERHQDRDDQSYSQDGPTKSTGHAGSHG